MKTFEEKKFTIPELSGISKKTIDEHLKLYAGYVKHTNVILQKIEEMAADSEKNAYALGELQRRFGFEFDGMRNHEYYFSSFEGGATVLDSKKALYQAIETEWGNFDGWLNRFKAISLTRGIGWAILYFDPHTGRLVHAWVDEQHLGHLTGLTPILTLDMWEHSFLFDYAPVDKKKYVEAFFSNLNWGVVDERYVRAYTTIR